MNKPGLFLIGIIIVAAVFRLWHLGSIPPGLANDEAGYIYSAYSIWKTGKDPSGRILPLSIELDNSFSPVYIYATAPFVGLLGLSPTTGRLPFALTGIGCVLLLYLVAKRLFKNDTAALVSAGLLAITPWHIHVSRAAFDANFALFFTLLFLYAFLRTQKDGLRMTLLAIGALVLAFYSYHATKVYLLALVPLLILTHRKTLPGKTPIIYMLGVVLLVLSFFGVERMYGQATRSQVFLWNNATEYAKAVNWEREKNTFPYALRPLFSNKLQVMLRQATQTYLEAYSPQFLFLYGETGALSSVYGGIINQGALYIWMLPLLLIGFSALRKLPRDTRLVLLILGFLAPLPSAVAADRTFIFRSFMLLIPLSLVMGLGVTEFAAWTVKKKRIAALLLSGVVLVVVGFSVMDYVVHMFYRYPVYGAERWFESSRQLAEYLHAKKSDYPEIVVVQAGPMFYFQYGIFNRAEPEVINTAWKSGTSARIENIRFTDGCPKFTAAKPGKPASLIFLTDICSRLVTAKPVYEIRDKGEPLKVIWKAYEFDGAR